jgi:hypothetical protein
VTLVRQRAQGLAGERERPGVDRELTGAGADHRAGDTDVVTQVEPAEEVVLIGPQGLP